MVTFRLASAERTYELETGETLIGRGPPCQIVLDDPRVSRQHARLCVSTDRITVEDLDSRNGVTVNGQVINEPTLLVIGDQLGVGGLLLRLLHGYPPRSKQDASLAPTRRVDSFGVVGELAEKAIALGRDDEAERLLAGPLGQLLDEVRKGLVPSPPALHRATDLALALVEATGKGVWIDWLVELYLLLRRPWPSPVVDTLYASARRAAEVDRALLRQYCETLRSQEPELGPAELFLVGRIEGLGRILESR